MTDFMDTPLKATGMVTFTHMDKDGNILSKQTVKNLVVTTGLAHIAARMATSGIPTQMTHMALGTGSATPGLGDTTLGAQSGTRAELAVAGGSPSGVTIAYNATFGAVGSGGDVGLREAGIFNATSGGTMLCRTTFPVITKGENDSLAVNWVITLS